MNDLVDTTEMYLRTIFELGEEKISPIRARIGERLNQSGPTVSQTVSRMERDGLLNLVNDRNIVLTKKGRELAIQVIRKHRLAEALLFSTLNIPYEYLHEEACRWEHVMSTRVEKEIYNLLDKPKKSPFGTLIPGLSELIKDASSPSENNLELIRIADLPLAQPTRVIIKSIGELLQENNQILKTLLENDFFPDKEFLIERDKDSIKITNPFSKQAFALPKEYANALNVELIKGED